MDRPYYFVVRQETEEKYSNETLLNKVAAATLRSPWALIPMTYLKQGHVTTKKMLGNASWCMLNRQVTL